MVSLSWTEAALSERETRVGDNDPFQPPSAVLQDQDKKHPFGRWPIATVVVLITIAFIGGLFSLHWNATYPMLHVAYYGHTSNNPSCSAPDSVQQMSGGSLTLYQIVEDHTHGTFTGLISESGGCGGGCNGTIQDGTLTSGEVSFTFAPYPESQYCGAIITDFSGSIQSDGRITGQCTDALGVRGNFDLTPGGLSP
jgi:hypothetical protein